MGKMLDRNLKGVGRIQRAFGTDDPDTIDAIKVMVSTLHKTGDFTLLEAIRDGKLTLLEVYNQWKVQKVHTIAPEGILMFDPTVYDWLDGYTDIKEKTKQGYRECFNVLKKTRPNFPLNDLPKVLTDYRKTCQKKGTNKQFNNVRDAVRSFLRNYFDEFHVLYQGVVKVKPLVVQRAKLERAWSVKEVYDVLVKIQREDVRDQFWTMCITGAGMEEYRNGLTVEGNGIRVKGEKMAKIDDRRNRLVPKIASPAPLVVQEKAFRKYLSDASGGTIEIYDARRCYSRWAQEAGIPFDRVKQYMGHAPLSMTHQYGRGKLEDFLKEDAKKFQEYLAKEIEREEKEEEFVPSFKVAFKKRIQGEMK